MVVSATPSSPATFRRRSRSRRATRLFYVHVGAGGRSGCSPRWGGGSTHASSAVTLSMLGLVIPSHRGGVLACGPSAARGFHAPSIDWRGGSPSARVASSFVMGGSLEFLFLTWHVPSVRLWPTFPLTRPCPGYGRPGPRSPVLLLEVHPTATRSRIMQGRFWSGAFNCVPAVEPARPAGRRGRPRTHGGRSSRRKVRLIRSL